MEKYLSIDYQYSPISISEFLDDEDEDDGIHKWIQENNGHDILLESCCFFVLDGGNKVYHGCIDMYCIDLIGDNIEEAYEKWNRQRISFGFTSIIKERKSF